MLYVVRLSPLTTRVVLALLLLLYCYFHSNVVILWYWHFFSLAAMILESKLKVFAANEILYA